MGAGCAFAAEILPVAAQDDGQAFRRLGSCQFPPIHLSARFTCSGSSLGTYRTGSARKDADWQKATGPRFQWRCLSPGETSSNWGYAGRIRGWGELQLSTTGNGSVQGAPSCHLGACLLCIPSKVLSFYTPEMCRDVAPTQNLKGIGVEESPPHRDDQQQNPTVLAYVHVVCTCLGEGNNSVLIAFRCPQGMSNQSATGDGVLASKRTIIGGRECR